MKTNVKDFIETFKANKIANTKIAPDAVEKYIKDALEVKTFLPFKAKREIVKQIVDANVKVNDGFKTVSSIDQFLGFVVSMLVSYTSLEIDDPYEAYDLLTEANLLQPIIECFKGEYDACDVLLKMELNDRLQTNTTPAIIAQFLDKISGNLGDFQGLLSEKLSELDLSKVLGSAGINNENIANILSVLNKEK